MKQQRNIAVIFSLFFLLLTASLAFAEEGFTMLTAEELNKLIVEKGESITVVDARNPEEYQEVHIKGAINVPEKVFTEQADKLPQDKARQLVIYCNGVKCSKSKKAAQKAKDLGYTNILVYPEGMPVWEEKGLPVYAGPDYEKRIETTKMAPKDLQALMQKRDAEVTVVDVRDPEEFREGHVPGAINIPSEVFASQSGQLDKQKTIVVTCNGGGRSYTAYRKLMKLGYEKIAQMLFQDWKDQGLPVETAAK